MPATASKSTRTVRWAEVPAGGIVIREGHKEDRYAVREFDSPMGRAFHVEKFGPRGGTAYDVLLAADQRQHLCDCLGFLHTGHCRHVDSLAVLLSR